MKIAIIGGGWVGCHLAHTLKKEHEIKLFEKNKLLFQETSYNNQNRLHLGYHYARNYKTREMCLYTFDRFLHDYGFIVKKVNKNLYCVPNSTSLIDYQTYLQIFKDYDFDFSDNFFNGVEGCINTKEMCIDFTKISDFFNRELIDVVINKKVNNRDLKKMLLDYDLVINATNNQLLINHDKNFFFELTMSLVYTKKNNTFFDAVTLVDGELFSIYPYKDDLYTVTDVKHTPIKKFKTIDSLKSFERKNITDELIMKKRELIESRIKKYYPKFNDDFTYHSFFISTKSKMNDQSDNRSPIITKKENLINCFTGKIQGIYLIEDYIKTIIHGN